MGWLDRYLEYVAPTEPPPSYHLWTGISMVAAALSKRVFTRIGGLRVFPNFYIILVGPSGARKTTAMRYGKDLLKAAGVKLAPDTTSGWQALINLMASKRFAEKARVGGIGDITHHSLTLFADELQAFLRDDHELDVVLTGLFDADDLWEYYTVKREMDTVPWPFFNMIGGTTPEGLRAMVPVSALEEGFAARLILVVEDNALRSTDAGPMERLRIPLIQELGRIRALSGEMAGSKEFDKRFLAFYTEQVQAIREGKPPVEGRHLTGYCSRRAMYAKKLSMIHRASEGEGMELTPTDLEWALLTLTEVERRMPEAFAGHGKIVNASVLFRLQSDIRVAQSITISALLRSFEYDLTWEGLWSMLQGMERSGKIAVKMDPDGKDGVVVWMG